MSRSARGRKLCGQKTASAVGTELGIENVFFGSLRWAVSKDCMAKTESLIVGRGRRLDLHRLGANGHEGNPT